MMRVRAPQKIQAEEQNMQFVNREAAKKACVIGAKQRRGGKTWPTIYHISMYQGDRRKPESFNHGRICLLGRPTGLLPSQQCTCMKGHYQINQQKGH